MNGRVCGGWGREGVGETGGLGTSGWERVMWKGSGVGRSGQSGRHRRGTDWREPGVGVQDRDPRLHDGLMFDVRGA